MSILPPRRLSVAPMLDWTNRHYRYFARLISQHTWLYSEMITTGALLHGDAGRFLAFDPSEEPIVLQLGGSDPQALASCTKKAYTWGYNEVNLNVGCPSERVQTGSFGACLMAEPQLVASCIQAMQDASPLPISIKHRIGLNEDQSYSVLRDFVGTVAATGCNTFVVHARNAILKGLSPKQNREIPPLNYAFVYQLKHDFPDLNIIINGGIKTLSEAAQHLQQVDGVMIGREAYHNPYLLAEADALLYNDASPTLSRAEIMQKMLIYCEKEMQLGTPIAHITRHLLGLYQGVSGARAWRRLLSDSRTLKQQGIQALYAAEQLIQQYTLHEVADHEF